MHYLWGLLRINLYLFLFPEADIQPEMKQEIFTKNFVNDLKRVIQLHWSLISVIEFVA